MEYLKTYLRDDFETWNISRSDRLNAIGTSLACELAQALQSLKTRIKQNNDVHGLIISASPCLRKSQTIWIAGGDLKELCQLDRSGALHYSRTLSQVCYELERLPIPVITVIDGTAIGGGAELALASDIRIGTERSSFVFKQLEVGLSTGYGGAKRLCHLIGRAQAQKLLYTDISLNAERALDMGILSILGSSKILEETLTQSIEYLKSLGPEAFAAQKRMLWSPFHNDGFQGYERELEEFTKLWRNPKHRTTLDRYK